MLASEALEIFVQEQENFLDSFIETGSEQELFAASYIHGHFSLVVAKELFANESKVDEEGLEETKKRFAMKLNESVETAIQNRELDREDAADVKKMMSKLASIG